MSACARLTSARFRFDHTSEEHVWASHHHGRVLSRDDGNSIASTQLDIVGDAADELGSQVDADVALPGGEPHYAATDTAACEGGHGHIASSPEGTRLSPLINCLSGSPAQPPQAADSSAADALTGTSDAHAAADNGLSPDVAAAGTLLALLLHLLFWRQLGV